MKVEPKRPWRRTRGSLRSSSCLGPCSALKGETVPDSLPATPKSPPTRRVPPRATPGQTCRTQARVLRHNPRMDTEARGSHSGTSLGIRMALLAPWSFPSKESSVSPKKEEEKAGPRAPSYIPCPMLLFHLAVPQLNPFMINQKSLPILDTHLALF